MVLESKPGGKILLQSPVRPPQQCAGRTVRGLQPSFSTSWSCSKTGKRRLTSLAGVRRDFKYGKPAGMTVGARGLAHEGGRALQGCPAGAATMDFVLSNVLMTVISPACSQHQGHDLPGELRSDRGAARRQSRRWGTMRSWRVGVLRMCRLPGSPSPASIPSSRHLAFIVKQEQEQAPPERFSKRIAARLGGEENVLPDEAGTSSDAAGHGGAASSPAAGADRPAAKAYRNGAYAAYLAAFSDSLPQVCVGGAGVKQGQGECRGSGSPL